MSDIDFDRLYTLRDETKKQERLIHCITNPISINDCANVVLTTGAKPIMAEHPDEVEDITKTAGALALNLGNITDARIESIQLSAAVASKNNIQFIIDVVGVSCSKLRLKLATDVIAQSHPTIIKGNVSEIKALAGIKTESIGIDVSVAEAVTRQKTEILAEAVDIAKAFAMKTNAVIVVSGAVDIITDGCKVYLVENGSPMMPYLTGTGCMLNVLIASYLSCVGQTGCSYIDAALLGTVVMGIAGEMAHCAEGIGTFHRNLLDRLYTITNEDIKNMAKINL